MPCVGRDAGIEGHWPGSQTKTRPQGSFAPRQSVACATVEQVISVFLFMFLLSTAMPTLVAKAGLGRAGMIS
jgi:hypothetical protein